MKRCPQCEFIYEDDQSLCDMDGVLLVFDSRNLPNHHALATVPAKPQPRRNRAVPAFATLILALVLGIVYYVSTQRRTIEPVVETPAASAATSNPVPAVNPTPEAKPSQETQASQVPPQTEEPKPATTKQPVTAPAKKAPVKAASTATPSVTKKDDSKVGSILKKTGRILKKPFKL
jgi:cell division septation protein DedD